MKKLVLLGLMGYAISGGMADAATYYVSQAGNNGHSCAQAQSNSTPRLTIGGGLGCLVAGDTLLVRAGTYDENINDNVPSGTSWSNKVRIAAYPGESVWLRPTTADYWVIRFSQTQAYIEFDGINLDQRAQSRIDHLVNLGANAAGTANHIRIMNAELIGPTAVPNVNSGIIAGNNNNEFLNLTVHGRSIFAFYIQGSNNLIDRCNIYGVDTAGIQIYKSGGNPTGNIVRNSIIHNLAESYFNGATDPRMWGILVSGTSNTVYNNIIYGINFPYATSNAGIFVYTGSGHKLWNNTIYNNTTDGIQIATGVSSTEVRNNIVYRNAGNQYKDNGSATVQSTNLFGVDPRFVDPSAADFQLQSGSPAIDAGTSLAAVATDIAGVPRPEGLAFDIGALEYRSPQAVPLAPTNLRVIKH